jgi:hypothetical protein
MDSTDLMESLSALGPRPAGGAALAQAHQLLAAELAPLGATHVHEERVAVRAWDQGKPSLELLYPEHEEVTCLQCVFTGAGDVSARLASEGDACADAVVLLRGHSIAGGKHVPLPARVEEVRRQGARAVIACSTAATGLPAVEVLGLRDGRSCPIPCVSVSRGVGERLDTAARATEVRVRLRTDGSERPAVCANLVADLGPDASTAETILLGAHLDSFGGVPGVFDNLTGVVTAWTIARALAPGRQGFRRRLRLIAYTGEETGWLGSKAYVSEHADELGSLRFVINFDSLFPATARGMAVMWSPEMRDYCARAFTASGSPVEVRNLFCMSSDYLPFMLAGIPAARPADFENSFPIWSHTAGDDRSHVDPQWVRVNAEVYAALLHRLLTDPEALPAQRLTPAAVRQRLEQEDVLDALAALGFGGL